MMNYKYIPNDIKVVDNLRAKIELNDASTKLLMAVDFSSTSTICEVFSASGVVGICTAKKNPKICVDEYVTNIQDYKTISENLFNNGVKNGHVYSIDELIVFHRKIDVVIIRTVLEKRKKLIVNAAVNAASLLNDGGILYLVGAKDEGVQSIAKQLSKIFFVSPETISYKKGVHLIGFKFSSVYVKPDCLEEEIQHQDIEVNGISLKLILEEGVFAKGKLDPATKLLLENIEIKNGENVLDLGCGSGVIGMIASKMANDVKVTLVDSDYLAIKIAEQNLKLNKIDNCGVIVSDGTGKIKGKKFDCVIFNPPFHQGREVSLLVAEQFIKESFDLLLPDGRLYVVCNIFLPQEKIINRIFGNSNIVVKNKSYKVIGAVKHQPVLWESN